MSVYYNGLLLLSSAARRFEKWVFLFVVFTGKSAEDVQLWQQNLDIHSFRAYVGEDTRFSIYNTSLPSSHIREPPCAFLFSI